MDYVIFQNEGHIATITLNKPPVNAMNLQMYREIASCFHEVNERDDIWVVVFRANGKLFSAGNDVNDFSGEYNLEYIEIIDSALKSVFACKVPVIAAINGAAIGGAFTMASASDIVVATPGTKFSLPEATLGKVGGSTGASFSLPQKVVRYMTLTGSIMTAEELLPYGFIHKVVDKENLDKIAYEIAEKIVNNPPISVQCTKESINRVYEAEKQLAKISLDHKISLEIAGSNDAKEALNAFREKRKPVFIGK